MKALIGLAADQPDDSASFLGSFRATSAVFLSIPLSALATFVVLYMMGSTMNTMILGGWRWPFRA